MQQSRPIEVLIADDHPVYRKGLVDIIAADLRLRLVGETGDGGQVLSLVRTLKPDVLLLDLSMPGTTGFDVAAMIRDEGLAVKVVVLTMHKDEAVFNQVMDLGVRGYVLKESAVQDVIASIAAVVDDEYYISPVLSQFLVRRHVKADNFHARNAGLAKLSATERRILKLISEHKTSKEIADRLAISVRTVDNHRMNISTKLDLHGSNSLLKFAIEHRSDLTSE